MPATREEFEGEVQQYLERGWKLVFMPYGRKGPTTPGWNAPGELITTMERAREKLRNGPMNIGLVHRPSGTVAIDIDDLVLTRTVMAEYGIDIDAIVAGSMQIVSPKANRAKALFAAPPGSALERKQITWPARDDQPGKIAIVDFRGGDNQDVLPFSAHPEGGFYAWAGSPILTPLPPELLEFWTHIEDPEFVETVQDLCPWKRSKAVHAAAVTRARSGEHADIIGQYNRQVPIEDALAQYGYKRRGKKWISRFSTSGMPGITILEGKAYVHHQSDPMSGFHDAFDFFVEYEHHGSFDSALRDAELHYADRRDPVPEQPPEWFLTFLANTAATSAAKRAAAAALEAAEVAEVPAPAIVAPATVQAPSQSIPDAMIRSEGGFVGRCTQWMLERATKPQPVLAHAAALSLAGLVLGQRIESRTGLRTHQYIIGVAPTGTGKENQRQSIQHLLDAAGLADKMMGPGDFASGSAIVSMVHEQPVVICQIDEFGLILKRVLRDKAQGHESDIERALLEFHASSISHRGTGRADVKLNKAKVTKYPCLNLHGTTTPETLFDAVSTAQLDNGLLNRLLVFFTPTARPKIIEEPPRSFQERPPQELIDWVQAAASLAGPGDLAGATGPLLIDFEGEARASLSRFKLEVEEARVAAGGLGNLWVRSAEHVAKLAMIFECSRWPAAALLAHAKAGTLVVGWPSVDRAVKEVVSVFEEMERQIASKMGDTDFGKLKDQVLGVIEKAGARGATERDIARVCRAFDRCEPRARDNLLMALKKTGDIFATEFAPTGGGAGRPRKAWTSRSNTPGIDGET